MSPPSLLCRLSRVTHQQDAWKRRAQNEEGGGHGAAAKPPAAQRKKRKSVLSAAASVASVRRRIVRSAQAMETVMEARHEGDRAEAVNEVILKLPTTERKKLREMASISQERFLAQRDVIGKLKRDYRTTQASLDLRLSNFMS
eukprot:795029-Pleurochrysis_carterae.AAC.1